MATLGALPLWQQAAYAVGAAVGLFVLYQLVTRTLKGIREERMLHNMPKVPSRYPFSHLVDLVTNPPWDIMQKWCETYGRVVSAC